MSDGGGGKTWRPHRAGSRIGLDASSRKTLLNSEKKKEGRVELRLAIGLLSSAAAECEEKGRSVSVSDAKKAAHEGREKEKKLAELRLLLKCPISENW